MTDVSITHANPEVDRAPAAILEIEDLVVKYPLRVGWFGRANQYVYAVRGVSLSVNAGQTVALVGESGCGKTSLGRAALGLIKSAAGRVRFGGELISAMPRAAMRPLRPRMQMVFQDPFSCLNPRMPVATIVGEALLAHGRCGKSQLHQRVNDVLAQVGLEAQHKSRYPHEFSGGQRQRIGIARALALEPELIVCDEPVSALDVSVQAQILNLLQELQDRHGIAYLFISHDLNVVRYLADRVAVMYAGEIVEHGDAQAVLETPAHPYTRALVRANPVPDPDSPDESVVLEGEVPSLTDEVIGCAFRTRCADAHAECALTAPARTRLDSGVEVACHLYTRPNGLANAQSS